MIVVPFEAAHLDMLTDFGNQEELVRPLLGTVRDARYEDAGPAFSAMVGSKVVGCAGLVEMTPYRAYTWALMPKQAGTHPGDGVWRGQVVLRVAAVARGIVQMYPDGTDWARILAEALMARFNTFVERLPVDPREQAVVTYKSQPQGVLDRKQSIMRDVDRLLASVAGRAIEVEMAQAALVDILQHVFDLDTPGVKDSKPHRKPSS